MRCGLQPHCSPEQSCASTSGVGVHGAHAIPEELRRPTTVSAIGLPCIMHLKFCQTPAAPACEELQVRKPPWSVESLTPPVEQLRRLTPSGGLGPADARLQ